MPNDPNRQTERELIARAFASRMRDDDLHDVLCYLNSLTDYRFTGVYRLTPGLVVSIALCDREHPDRRLGTNVRMADSYCWLTGTGDSAYTIEDAPNDARLGGHAARDNVKSYLAVLLRDASGQSWGTLCHFDVVPRPAPADALAQLEGMRPLLEELFVRDRAAAWQSDAASLLHEPLDQARRGEISLG